MGGSLFPEGMLPRWASDKMCARWPVGGGGGGGGCGVLYERVSARTRQGPFLLLLVSGKRSIILEGVGTRSPGWVKLAYLDGPNSTRITRGTGRSF